MMMSTSTATSSKFARQIVLLGGGGPTRRISGTEARRGGGIQGRRRVVTVGTALLVSGITVNAIWKEKNATNVHTSLPRTYQRSAIQSYWKERPISIAKRLLDVLYELGPISIQYIAFKYSKREKDDDDDEEQIRIRNMAIEFREALTNLGPAFIKAGQQLAIRPDLVSPIVLEELQKLCDSVRTTMSKEVAMNILVKEIGTDKLEHLQDLELVASASLGQVYKAQLVVPGGEGKDEEDVVNVAIKIQRPDMMTSFSLDLYLLQLWGDIVDSFTSTFTKQAPYHRDLFDAFSRGSYSELDYEQEAKNQIHFQQELAKRGMGNDKVIIPNVFLDYTTRRVICTEWVDGVPLANCSPDTIQKLIPVGVELFLIQLLDIGLFHADPHAGNLLVSNKEGKLCLLDFGLCSFVDPKSRKAMTKALTNLLYRDFDTLVERDAKDLGFLPEDYDTEQLKPVLTKVLSGGLLESGSNMEQRKRKLMEISNELNEIFFKYPFQVPAFFALVTRGLCLLEGIALSGNSQFDIFKASLPFVASRRAASLVLSSRTSRNEDYGKEEHSPKNRRKRTNIVSWLVAKYLWRKEDASTD